MPRLDRSKWAELSYQYLEEKRPRKCTTERGVISKVTKNRYRVTLKNVGEILGKKNPKNVTLEELRHLENYLEVSESSVHVYMSVVRNFLIWAGNPDVIRWKIKSRDTPTKRRVWLTEMQVAQARMAAHQLGVIHELIYSLAVDNGLRTIDIHRLTLANAQEFLGYGESIIIGKGINGGSPAKQVINRMTLPVLERYLKFRAGLNPVPTTDRLIVYTPAVGRTAKKTVIMTTQKMSFIIRDISRAYGIHFTPHDLRATYGNRLSRKGVPIETIAMLMRHQNPDVTFKRYIGRESDQMRNALETLNSCPERGSQQ